jgi:DNA-binding XRE family transcriptional regulator
MITASKLSAKKKPRVLKAWSNKEPIFHCKIREMRKKLNLTLRDVSGSGVDIATLSRAERGHELRLSNALAIAAFFECDPRDIWSVLP